MEEVEEEARGRKRATYRKTKPRNVSLSVNSEVDFIGPSDKVYKENKKKEK